MTTRQLGIDHLGEAWRLAEVTFDAGRPHIKSLRHTENETEAVDLVAAATSVSLAVPDDRVLVKSLYLPEQEPGAVRDRALFELAAGLLEPESRFAFELIATAQPERYLGLIYRKQQLPAWTGPGPENPINHRLRAAALGSGYLNFCRAESGDLIALADLSGSPIPVCLIYRRRIAALAWIGNGFDFTSETDRKRVAIELKTIINFRLSALADEGVAVPLARLVVSGRHATPDLIASLAAYFPTGVSEAVVNPAFLSDSVPAETGAAANYLVALGLAVG